VDFFADFLATFLAAGFLAATFFAGAFFVITFLAATFFSAFLATTFFTAFLTRAFFTALVATFFFAGDFFVAMVYYPSYGFGVLKLLTDITASSLQNKYSLFRFVRGILVFGPAWL
jgi:hypothetical protein